VKDVAHIVVVVPTTRRWREIDGHAVGIVQVPIRVLLVVTALVPLGDHEGGHGVHYPLGGGLHAGVGHVLLDQAGKIVQVQVLVVEVDDAAHADVCRRGEDVELADAGLAAADDELAESIKQYGIIQPIVVKKESGKYRIVAGERRFRAAKIAGLRELKAIMELACVMTNSDTIEAENILFNSSNAKSDFLLEEDTLKGYVQKIVGYYLNKYNNNVMVVADKLDIGKSTIYRMLKNNGHPGGLLG